MISKKQRVKHKKSQNEFVVDIVVIDVAFYSMLIDRQNKKQNIQCFFLTMKKIENVLTYYETNSNFVVINVVVEQTCDDCHSISTKSTYKDESE